MKWFRIKYLTGPATITCGPTFPNETPRANSSVQTSRGWMGGWQGLNFIGVDDGVFIELVKSFGDVVFFSNEYTFSTLVAKNNDHYGTTWGMHRLNTSIGNNK